MIEQYIFNLITADTTLRTLLDAGSGKYHIYPGRIERSIVFSKAITFSTIITTDVFPKFTSVQVQFNIFAGKQSDTVAISQALANIFNGDNNKSSGGIEMVYSQRKSESDLPSDFDNNLFQRQATYYFKIK